MILLAGVLFGDVGLSPQCPTLYTREIKQGPDVAKSIDYLSPVLCYGVH